VREAGKRGRRGKEVTVCYGALRSIRLGFLFLLPLLQLGNRILYRCNSCIQIGKDVRRRRDLFKAAPMGDSVSFNHCHNCGFNTCHPRNRHTGISHLVLVPLYDVVLTRLRSIGPARHSVSVSDFHALYRPNDDYAIEFQHTRDLIL
jgi:hypothetical protein